LLFGKQAWIVPAMVVGTFLVNVTAITAVIDMYHQAQLALFFS